MGDVLPFVRIALSAGIPIPWARPRVPCSEARRASNPCNRLPLVPAFGMSMTTE